LFPNITPFARCNIAPPYSDRVHRFERYPSNLLVVPEKV
jgi:hypothetical protein